MDGSDLVTLLASDELCVPVVVRVIVFMQRFLAKLKRETLVMTSSPRL